MTTQIHPGEVVHSMDHLVLDLAAVTGQGAYFTIYSLGLMRDVGPGRVALMRVHVDGRTVDRCFAETIGLGMRMQSRLRAMGGPTVGVDHTPIQATIRRVPTSGQGEHWVVESADHTVTASWSAPDRPFWLSAPAPVFHPTRDYVTTMIGYRHAELVLDGTDVPGVPYDHPGWGERFGFAFSSCHVALAETAIEARS
ncbi:MAG TPA: hypothetical protein VLB67_13040 [Acidimicrobiia bacterium]|nr:hypothetical protein [Acidimicrobiia bacterium]